MPWLAHYNSKIDQRIGKVKITKCPEECRKQQRLKQGKLGWQKQKEKEKEEEEKKQKEKKPKKRIIVVKRMAEEQRIWNKKKEVVKSEKKAKKLALSKFHK